MIENYAFKDLFESKHSILKPIRKQKRTSVNPLKTIIEGDERATVYNLSNSLLKSPVQKNVKKVFTNKVVEDYVKKLKSEIMKNNTFVNFDTTRLRFALKNWACTLVAQKFVLYTSK